MCLSLKTKMMRNIEYLEVIQITAKEGKLVATMSYRDTTVNDLNNGYAIIDVPINGRELQLSSRGNVLVDQSIKAESVAVANDLQREFVPLHTIYKEIGCMSVTRPQCRLISFLNLIHSRTLEK